MDNGVFVYCHVGDRATYVAVFFNSLLTIGCVYINEHRWKDPQNVFRTDPRLRLTGVPTLLKWGTVSSHFNMLNCDIDNVFSNNVLAQRSVQKRTLFG